MFQLFRQGFNLVAQAFQPALGHSQERLCYRGQRVAWKKNIELLKVLLHGLARDDAWRVHRPGGSERIGKPFAKFSALPLGIWILQLEQ